MPSNRKRTTIVLTEKEEKALRGFFQEKENEPLSELIRKAMRDGITVEQNKCLAIGQGKYLSFC